MAWALKEVFPVTNWDASGGANTTRSAVGTVSVSVGDTIIVVVAYRCVGDTAITVADDLGNTYTERTTPKYFNSASDASSGVKFFDAPVTSAGTPTVTATAANASSFFGCFARSYSGLSATPYQAAAAALRTGSASSATDGGVSNAVTISTPPVLLLGVAYNPGPSNGADISVGTGFGNVQTGRKANGLADYVKIEDKRVTSGPTATATFTNAQAGGTFVGMAVAYSEAITAPTIQGGTASPVHQSTGNTLTGVNFGASQTGSAASVIGGVGQTETGWSSTTVTYTADRGANLNGVAVNAVVTDPSGVSSDPYALTGFQPPAGWSYVTLTSVWPVAAERIQSSADLAIGNQIEWDDATISIDASGVILWPPGTPDGYTFNARVGVSGDGWGATEVQTYNPASASGPGRSRLALKMGIGL